MAALELHCTEPQMQCNSFMETYIPIILKQVQLIFNMRLSFLAPNFFCCLCLSHQLHHTLFQSHLRFEKLITDRNISISDQFLETLKDIQSRLNFYSLCCNIRLRSFFCPADPVVSCFRFCGRIRRFTEINIVVQASALLHKTYPLVIKKFLFGDNWSYCVFYLAMTRQ